MKSVKKSKKVSKSVPLDTYCTNAKKNMKDAATILLSLNTNITIPSTIMIPATQQMPRTIMYPLGAILNGNDPYVLIYSKKTGNTTMVLLSSDPEDFWEFTCIFCANMDQKGFPRKKFMRAVGCMAIRKFPKENGSNFVQNLETLKSFEI